MVNQTVMQWLLEGDVSIRYQAFRDLLNRNRPDLKKRIMREGWGAHYMSCRNPDGSWGRGFYQPKWTSSHYTLLDLKNLSVSSDNPGIQQSIIRIVRDQKCRDGGINPSGTIKESDVCINGMFLVYACYFFTPENSVKSVIDFILGQKMKDGGFNCRSNRTGANHSSLHTTLSVLEGILEYQKNGYNYRSDELELVACESREFILQHRLYKSDKTGDIIHRDLLKFPFPSRWKYNILRCLDYFRSAQIPWDDRMADALEVVIAKQQPDGRWLAEAAHPGATHLVMDKPRSPGRWNTLLSQRVLDCYHSSLNSGVSASPVT